MRDFNRKRDGVFNRSRLKTRRASIYFQASEDCAFPYGFPPFRMRRTGRSPMRNSGSDILGREPADIQNLRHASSQPEERLGVDRYNTNAA